jgi:hypothetical protein
LNEYLDPSHFQSFISGVNSNDGTAGGVPAIDYEFTVIEPLMHPLLEMKPGIRSLYNLTSLNINLNFLANRFDALVYYNEIADTIGAAGSGTTAHTLAFGPGSQNPTYELLIKYITPLDILPVNYNYEYSRLNRLSTSSKNIALAGSHTFTTTITSSTVPDYLIIQVNKLKLTDNTYRKHLDMGNAYISSINVNVNNMEGRFSSANAHHLFQMSARNGYHTTWDEWQHFGKQVLVIKLGQDIQRVLPGSKSQFSAVISVNAISQLAVATDYELTVIQVTPNMYQFNGTTVTSLEGFDYNQVQQAVNSGDVPELDNYNDQPQSKDGQGISFKKFWRGVKKTVGTLTPAMAMAAGAYGGPAAMMAADSVGNLVAGQHGSGLGHHGGMVYMGGQGRLGSGQLGSGQLGSGQLGGEMLGSGNLGSGLKKKHGGSRMYQ